MNPGSDTNKHLHGIAVFIVEIFLPLANRFEGLSTKTENIVAFRKFLLTSRLIVQAEKFLETLGSEIPNLYG